MITIIENIVSKIADLRHFALEYRAEAKVWVCSIYRNGKPILRSGLKEHAADAVEEILDAYLKTK